MIKISLSIIAILSLFYNNSIAQQISIRGDIIGNSAPVVSIAAINNDTIVGLTNSYNNFFIIIRSTDAGHTWRSVLQQTINKNYQFIVSLGNATVIAAGTTSNIIRSTDAGETWNEITCPPNLEFKNIQFENSLVGYISCTLGQYLKTSDGGITWSLHSLGFFNEIHTMQWITADTGYACGNGLFRTVNGGTTWTLISSVLAVAGVTAMHWTNSMNGFVGDQGGYHVTSDGGLNWTPGISPVSIRSLQVLSDSILFISDDSFIWKSNDAGITWQLVQTATNTISSFAFTDTSHGWYAVGNFLMYSTSGGIQWNQSVTNLPVDFNAIFPGLTAGEIFHKDSLLYYFSAASGYVLRSFNNGDTWDGFIMPQVTREIDFIDAATGFFTSSGSVLTYFSDTGHVTNIRSINTDINTMVFDSLHLLKMQNLKTSSDGGLSFTNLFGGLSGAAIQKMDSVNGFALPFANALIRTRDGGVSYFQAGISPQMNSLNFADTTYGLVYGTTFNVIAITNDGGYSFTDLSPNLCINNAYRLNSTDIVILDCNHDIYLSRDTGQNFIQVLPGWSNCIEDIYRTTDRNWYILTNSFIVANFHFDGVVNVGMTEEKIDRNVFVFPNPIANSINIKNNFGSGEEIYFGIYDLTGRLISSGSIENFMDKVLTIQSTNLKAGYYILNLKNEKNHFQFKIVKS